MIQTAMVFASTFVLAAVAVAVAVVYIGNLRWTGLASRTVAVAAVTAVTVAG